MGFCDATEAIPLPERFAQLKDKLVQGKEIALLESWRRLLQALREEIDHISAAGSRTIPTISHDDLGNPVIAARFSKELKRSGAAVIRRVVSERDASSWEQDTREYLTSNPYTKGFPADNPQLFELFWSPAQLKARAHPRILTTQRLAMGFWDSGCGTMPVSSRLPVTYADRVRRRTPGDTTFFPHPHMDSGSVERWEPNGYGQSGTYQAIFDGHWEDYNPWDVSRRCKINNDLYAGADTCTMFRMFQGFLALSPIAPGEGSLRICPMLKLSTAYLPLRPLFSPICANTPFFLDPSNWRLEHPLQNSILHGALPSYTQEISDILHPHLQLKRSLVSLPALRPGDYVIWHPDAIHAGDSVQSGLTAATVFYIPACPLSQINALYLARQRKAFLLGSPAPDFEGGAGESYHIGRPGVAEVSEAGGEAALRAMGLLPWDEDEAHDQEEAALVRMANALLFPERFGLV